METGQSKIQLYGQSYFFKVSLFQAQAVSGHEKCYSFNFQLNCRREARGGQKIAKK